MTSGFHIGDARRIRADVRNGLYQVLLTSSIGSHVKIDVDSNILDVDVNFSDADSA